MFIKYTKVKCMSTIAQRLEERKWKYTLVLICKVLSLEDRWGQVKHVYYEYNRIVTSKPPQHGI